MNTTKKFYFSIQYSAIQKTVLRHNRLWSIAGISQQLSYLNEIEFKREAKKRGGTVLVAGGGKFTARFKFEEDAMEAREAIVRRLATTFPMLEFQVSGPVKAESMEEAKEKHGLIEMLNEQKQSFRGYATSYLPHLATCAECGEYPAEKGFKLKESHLCRTCSEAWEKAKINLKNLDSKKEGLTSLEMIYAKYLKKVPDACNLDPIYNFEDLFPDKEEGARNRMAVWFSDINNMNQKVPIWLSQEEDKIPEIFDKVKEVNIEIVANALVETFPKPSGQHLPFRLVVAGGDDLCVVMPEDYVLDFALNLDAAVRNKIKKLDTDTQNPLNTAWLEKEADIWRNKNPDKRKNVDEEIGPYSFGSSFIITSTHTPFKRIHETGEELMKAAKEETGRLGNSINWRIMAEEEAVSDVLLDFERRLFISSEDNSKTNPRKAVMKDRLSFEEYVDLKEKFSKISSSHRHAIISMLIKLRQESREHEFEDWLKCYDSGEREKNFSGLLKDECLREGSQISGKLVPSRIATLFELMGISKA